MRPPTTQAQRARRIASRRRSRRNRRARDTRRRRATREQQLAINYSNSIHNNRSPSPVPPDPTPEVRYSPISSPDRLAPSYSPVPSDQLHNSPPCYYFDSDFPCSPLPPEEPDYPPPSSPSSSTSSVEFVGEFPLTTGFSHFYDSAPHATHFLQYEGEITPGTFTIGPGFVDDSALRRHLSTLGPADIILTYFGDSPFPYMVPVTHFFPFSPPSTVIISEL